MTSRLQKHKQILSLLNSRKDIEFPTIQSENDASIQPTQRELLSDNRLIHQVYQFHKSIIQNLNAGLITIDLNGEITFANKSAAHLLGLEVSELLGINVKDFFQSSTEAEQFLNLCTQQGKKIDDWESTFWHRTKKEIIVGINASYLEDARNNYEGVVLLFRDLTEVYHLRSQVERMEQLALLGELSAGIAHEIRNPLAGIKAATQLLAENKSNDDLQTQLMSRVIREVDKANVLLKEFFKFARPTRPKPAFCSIRKIVDGVYLLVASRLKTQNIQFSTQSRGIIPQVYADETQIEQVLLNLFINAIDAMKSNGELLVELSAKTYQLPLDKSGSSALSNRGFNYVLVKVSDTGSGIPADAIDKIFNPFFTSKKDGLGLGLSICSRLVAENFGKIDVSSRENTGTRFTLALPTFVHA